MVDEFIFQGQFSSKNVLYWFEWSLKLLGIGDTNYPKLQKLYLYFSIFNVFCMVVEAPAFALNDKFEAIDRLTTAFLGFTAFTALVPTISLFLFKNDYKKCILWCNNCDKKVANSSHKIIFANIYDECNRYSLIMFKGNLLFYFWFSFFLTGFPNLVSGLQQKFNLLPKLYLFCVFPTDTAFVFSIAAIQLQQAAFIICYSMGVVMSVVMITMNFCGGCLDAMGQILVKIDEELNNVENRWKYFLENVKVIIDLHSEVTVMETVAVKLMAKTLMAYVLAVHGITFLCWLLFFIEASQYLLLFAGLACFAEYYLICFVNDRLNEAHNRFYLQLCTIHWYGWQPRERRMLLLILAMAKKPKLLRAGSVQEMNYESLLDFIKRGYTAGIILKDVMG